jgi:DegV family protein with EDD domain
VSVVDSLNASMGLGGLAIAAAEQAASGATLDAILDDLASRRGRVKLYGALDTLEYIKKGGRIGGARALLGSMLSIKPIVELREGVVEEAGKVRTRSKALRLLVDKVKEHPIETLAVLQGLAPDLEELLEMLDPIFPRDQIIVGEIGPVIGTHAGPGVIGVTFQTARS